jgi:chromosome partitioning protein
MEIISIINQKGGAGKTTTAHALGTGLAKKGFKVLFIDTDGQANLTSIMKADKNKSKLLDLLTGKADINEIIQKTNNGDILAGNKDLFQADIVIRETGKEYRLKEEIANLNERYDYIIIDTPVALGILTVNAMVVANSILIASQSDWLNLSGIECVRDTMETVRKYCNSKLYIRGILLTRFKERTRLNRDFVTAIDEFARELNTKVYETKIRDSIVISESQVKQQSIFDYDSNSNVAKDYEAFVEEFLQDKHQS